MLVTSKVSYKSKTKRPRKPETDSKKAHVMCNYVTSFWWPWPWRSFNVKADAVDWVWGDVVTREASWRGRGSLICRVYSMLLELLLLARLHIVQEGQTSDALWRLSSVVVCNTLRRHICNVPHQGAAHGGPVVLRLVRATPCCASLPHASIDISDNRAASRMFLSCRWARNVTIWVVGSSLFT